MRQVACKRNDVRDDRPAVRVCARAVAVVQYNAYTVCDVRRRQHVNATMSTECMSGRSSAPPPASAFTSIAPAHAIPRRSSRRQRSPMIAADVYV